MSTLCRAQRTAWLFRYAAAVRQLWVHSSPWSTALRRERVSLCLILLPTAVKYTSMQLPPGSFQHHTVLSLSCVPASRASSGLFTNRSFLWIPFGNLHSLTFKYRYKRNSQHHQRHMPLHRFAVSCCACWDLKFVWCVFGECLQVCLCV